MSLAACGQILDASSKYLLSKTEGIAHLQGDGTGVTVTQKYV